MIAILEGIGILDVRIGICGAGHAEDLAVPALGVIHLFDQTAIPDLHGDFEFVEAHAACAVVLLESRNGGFVGICYFEVSLEGDLVITRFVVGDADAFGADYVLAGEVEGGLFGFLSVLSLSGSFVFIAEVGTLSPCAVFYGKDEIMCSRKF